MKIRILIADDHAILRSGMRAWLERSSDVEVAAEASNGFDALKAVAETPVDVMVLDLSMPGLSGSRVAEAVVREHPHVAIVILTMFEDSYHLQELFKIGVKGFVLKKSSGTNLLQAIRAAYRGESYVDPLMAGRLVSDYAGVPSGQKGDRIDMLSPREQEVCTLLAYGHTANEIASKLSISERTVESHRANILGKLGFKTRAEIVRFAMEYGLLKLA